MTMMTIPAMTTTGMIMMTIPATIMMTIPSVTTTGMAMGTGAMTTPTTCEASASAL